MLANYLDGAGPEERRLLCGLLAAAMSTAMAEFGKASPAATGVVASESDGASSNHTVLAINIDVEFEANVRAPSRSSQSHS